MAKTIGPISSVFGGKTSKSIFDVVKKKQKQSVETGGEFRFAMDSGEAGKVAALLQQGASANSRVKSDPYPPLHYAIIKNRPDYVELLLEHGAAPNMPDQHGKLPLHHAARMGQFPSVRLLLANGANPQIPLTKRGWNVLHVCSFHGFENTIEVVLQMKPDMVHSKTEQWETPLHLAARGGHVHACELLLNGGALINSQIRGLAHQPLHEAAMRGYYEVCSLLVRHGADPYAKEYGTTNRTALKLARDFCHNNCVTVMLNGGRMEGIIDGKTASEIEMLNNDYNNKNNNNDDDDENNNNKKNVKKKQRNMEYGNNVSF